MLTVSRQSSIIVRRRRWGRGGWGEEAEDRSSCTVEKKKKNKFSLFFFYRSRQQVRVVARRKKTRGRQLTRTTDNRADSLIRAETTCLLANGRHVTGPQSQRGFARGPQIGTADLLSALGPCLSTETGRTATIIIAYDGRLLTGRHSCLFTAPILSASIKATRRCLTDWAEGKPRYFSFSLSSLYRREFLRKFYGTRLFFSSFGWNVRWIG